MITKIQKGLFLSAVAASIALISCSKDSEDEPATPSSCDVTCSNLEAYYSHQDKTCFKWGVNGSNESYYEVQYGLQGFTLGDGTMAIVNDNSYCDGTYELGKIYDYYVRVYCKNNLGYSEWFGPVSRYIDQ